MSTRANWFLADLDLDADPLTPSGGVEVIGQVIDLHSEPKLRHDLHGLVSRESRLFDAGISCAIKDQADSCCSACPVFTADETKPIAALCKIGRAQEKVLTALAVATHGPRAAD